MSRKPTQERNPVRRRDLLRGIGAGAAAGAAAVAAAVPLAGEALAASESNDEMRKARYQANSNDVKSFYRVNRYPS